MAKVDGITVPITYELTETSKAVLRPLIEEVVLDVTRKALEGAMIEDAISEEVKHLIRTEIRAALTEEEIVRAIVPVVSKALAQQARMQGMWREI